MPGPPPDPDARRRNAATIPTTKLPAGGYTGRAPKVPSSYALGPAGKAWWRWAWKTPQAAAWDPGGVYALARRAQLEDELAALGETPEEFVADLIAPAMDADLDDRDQLRELERSLEWLLSSLQRRAGGATSVMREMRELDDRFGLTSKGMTALRWKIVGEAEKKPAAAAPKPGAAARARAAGLSAVDPAG